MRSKNGSSWKSAAMGVALGALAGLLAKELNLQGIFSIWGSKSLWIFGAAVAGGVLGVTRWRWLATAAALGLGLLWLVVAWTPLCHWMSRDLVRRDTLGPADAVYVLGSDVQKDGELTTEAMRLAQKLASLPTRAIGLTKRAINAAWTSDLATQLEYEARLQTSATQTHDHREGLDAFLNKRRPVFLGH